MEWKKADEPASYHLFRENGYSPLVASALAKAGLTDLEQVKKHLHCDEFEDPGKIRNIGKATDVIWKHVYEGNRICVYGDYDADGITASAVMFLALRRLGANVTVRLPDRIGEGYGISKKAIDEQAELGAKLFITVDNGIRAIEETKYVKELGLDIVILDHHEPGEELPEADAVIDLHIPGESFPDTELTGSGLAWKVAHYMLEQMGEHDYAMSLVDIAAFGTVGDVAPLIGENRTIVKRAIRLMQSPGYCRPGVSALMKGTEHITAEDIAFRLAPCLNAPGRLTSGGASLPLILLIEDDPGTATELAARVHAENEHRKELQRDCYQSIREEAAERIVLGEKVLVILAENAPSGIAGLLAGNLREEFGRPSIVFCPKKNIEGETVWTGSARSVDAFHILNAIDTCKEYLVTYGGHKLAAGLTIKADKGMLEHFREAINKEAAYLTEGMLNPVALWDVELTSEEITDELYAQMESLEPFGAGAPRPVVKIQVAVNDDKGHSFMGAEGQHLKLFCDGYVMVGFSLAEKYIENCLPTELTAYGNLSLNYYRGSCTKQVSLLDFTC